ncbi:hypothetical protein BOX15_Mlig009135g2, partial [Macrostomum lignano]
AFDRFISKHLRSTALALRLTNSSRNPKQEINSFFLKKKQSETMRGLIFLTADNSLKLKNDLQDPKPNSEEVVVRVSHCGVCGTDLHIMQGHFPVAVETQLVLGHEFTGWLQEANTDSKKNQDGNFGTPVFVNPNGRCGYCIGCQEGRVHFCGYRAMGAASVGVGRDGGWAEFVAVPANQVHRMPKDLPMSTGILVEPISCVLHGYDRLFTAGAAKQLDPTDSVLILGAGIIGLLWACLLHQRGYRTIHISDISPERRQVVTNMKLNGMSPKQPTELLSNTYQLIVDCTGVPKALESAYKSLSSGGILCVFGCAPEGVKLNLPYYDLVNERSPLCFVALIRSQATELST